MDLGFVGYPFTWRNNQEARPIQQRLDRGLATMRWHETYPETSIRHVVLEGSDHAMLFLSTEKAKDWRGRKFSYDARWSKLEECRHLVAEEWRENHGGSHAFRFCEKLKALRRSLKEWYKGRGRNSKKVIDRLKMEIRTAYTSTNFASDEIKLKERELRTAQRNEEGYWRMKSRVQWLKEGDKNSKFFHAQTIKRRRFNQIKGLEDMQGVWQEDEPAICAIASSYFAELFKSCNPSQIEEIGECQGSRVSEEDNLALTAAITEEEIKAAAFQIPASRAPGPDGYTGCFYHDHWDTVGADVIRIVKAFWHSGSLLRKINHSNLVLIPKVNCPKNMTQYRPIALCNVIYKVIAKVLTNRLKMVMPKVICDNQSAFVAGKQIQDNILVVHEILHSLLHQKNGDRAGMAIKLDMAKAYDRVEWGFLLSMMEKLGFAPVFCNRIKECISSVSFSILINGNPTGYVTPERGLRQGDPLSPYLFLLCTEGFSMLLRRGMERGALHGFRVSPNGTPISHLFFADDSVLFGHASMEEANGMVEILRTYARGSGQMVNLTKSSVFFGSKTSCRVRRKIGHTLGIQCQNGFGKYLGLQADFGHSKKVVFEEVRDRLESRLAGWAEQFLSQAGKEVLVKAVAMALPNYAMSCFKLPMGVCRDLEKSIRDYWWRGSEQRKGVHWISWEKLGKQKRFGGLGFRDIQCFNLAFLAKIGWRLIHKPLSLLATVLKEKYYPGKNFNVAGKGRNTSWGWKGILEARKILFQGLRWRVGDGTCINIREDPWFPRASTFKVKPLVNLHATLVSDLIDSGTNTWRADLISASFHRDEVAPILSIPLSKSGSSDRLVWHHNVNGEYSVRSGYGIAKNLLENGALGRKGCGTTSEMPKNCHLWNLIWKLKVPNKIKIFIWRCCNNALAVRRNLKRRQMRIDNVCGVCGAMDESENHLFFQCPFSHQFWFCSSLQLNSFNLIGYDFLASWELFWTRVKEINNAEDILQEFAFGLWNLWKHRNEVVFKGIHRQPLELLEHWRRNIEEFRVATQDANLGDQSKGRPRTPGLNGKVCRWAKPKYGVLKINTDASWCKTTLRTGVSWVCRDFAGLLHGAGGSGAVWCQSAAAGEAYAIRTALLACVEYGFDNVIIESDAKVIIQMLKKELTHDFNFECILSDIEMLARRMTSVSFSFVPRECNTAAHSVAKFVFKEGRAFEWDCIGPEFLFNILAQDVNLSIRI